jgi:alanine racemase
MKRRDFFKTMGAGSLTPLSGPPLNGILTQDSSPALKGEVAGRMDPWIEVNLSHILWNFSQIKKWAKVPVMAVVKANAYGHGLVEVSRALEKAGVDWLMVGKLQEAIQLRQAGVRCSILNFGPFNRQDCEEIIGLNISQSVFSEDAVFLNEAASRLGKKASVHIDIDTGMSRTGILYDRALPFIEKIASLSQVKIEGLATTLTEDPEFDREQLKRFTGVCASAEKRGVRLGLRHAASSAGIFESPQFCLDMIRPGITLYGYYPNSQTQKEDLLKLRPALKLAAKVTFVKDLSPGESLSYHRLFTAPKKMRVATVGIGYSDGYPPQLGGKGWVSIRGKKYPVFPAVTANHTMIDLLNDPEIKVGDDVVLIDNQKNSSLTADVLAESSGVSDYRILIGLNPLLPRKFLWLKDQY